MELLPIDEDPVLIDQAVREHMARIAPDLRTMNWALVVVSTDPELSGSEYTVINDSAQMPHHTVGLFHSGAHVVLNGPERG